VPVVLDAAQANRSLTPLRRLALVSILCSLIGLAACGGSDTSAPRTTASAAPAPTGATVRTANCMLWKVLDPGDRRALVKGLRAFFSQRLDTGAHERLLPDDRAYQLITNYCRLPFARAFLLYRLYGNAAAFAGTSTSG
jgi:hypothetical protein